MEFFFGGNIMAKTKGLSNKVLIETVEDESDSEEKEKEMEK